MSDDNGPNAFKVHEIMIGRTRFPSNVLMAPLAGYTCFPFRLMAKRLGAGSACTEMVSADALKYNDRVCMKDCPRHLYIPEEIARVQRLLNSFGK